jgi:5-dehydro-2-deoxygluconokinase
MQKEILAMNAAVKRLDVICIGRVAVDLYAQQIGSRLEDVASFSKYLGGSSGNVAFGTAIQGLKSAMLARVGDEHNGRFLRETLSRAGVDTEYLITDKQRLTALVMLGIKDQETFPLIFYRDNCADMALTPDDINEEYIASSRALAVTGTHLSHANTRAAVLKALEYARRHGLRTALDIDYRPVLWGFTSLGDGETRFIESGPVTSQLQEVLHLFDLVVGTEEEFHIAGGSTDTLTALKNVRNATKATLVCKRGPMGCVVLEGDIPDSWDSVPLQQGVRVDVLNVLGAGDAFMSGLLRGWLNDEGWEQAAATPTPAARWWSHATAARRRCRPKSSSMTICCGPNRCRVRISTSASTICTASPAAVSSGRSCAFSPLTIVNSWPIWRWKPGAMKPAFRSSSCCCWPPPKRPRRRRVWNSAAAFSPTAPTASAR